jgi:hypothetical protein
MTPQSQAAGDLGLRLHLIGGAAGASNLISGTYQAALQAADTFPSSPQFSAGMGRQLMVTIAGVFDAASVVTDIRFKLQGMPRDDLATLAPFSTGSNRWVDIYTVDHLGRAGTAVGGATDAEHVYTLATVGVGNPFVDVLMTMNASMFSQLQVVAEATGGATKAGDIVFAWANFRG